jgi:hypothetical protein
MKAKLLIRLFSEKDKFDDVVKNNELVKDFGLTDQEYASIIMLDGFTALQHRQMDLYNNYMGRRYGYPNNGELDIHNKIRDLIRLNQLTILH